MNKSFSIYLDLVRFSAAFLVYLYHSNQRFLSKSILPASDYGHSSVIVFFVLSGFVIAFITETKESTLAAYSASRISRVFSVTVPAIALTVLLDGIGSQLNPEIYAGAPYDQFAARILMSLLLVNEVWMISVTSFSNVPYWSICYEFWYYAVFALVVFLPRRLGLIAASLLLLALGPKIILLAPLWWLGVLLYRWRNLYRLSLASSYVLALVSVVAIVIFHSLEIDRICTDWLKSLIGDEAHRNLTFSKFFVGDYLLGVLVFLNFAGMRNVLARHGLALQRIAKPVRFVANYTFTLYLLHKPLFMFWGAVVAGAPEQPWYWLSVTALTFASIGIIGSFTENRRYLLRDFVLRSFRRRSPSYSS